MEKVPWLRHMTLDRFTDVIILVINYVVSWRGGVKECTFTATGPRQMVPHMVIYISFLFSLRA